MSHLDALCGLLLAGMLASTASAAPWQQSYSDVLELDWREPDLRRQYGDSSKQFAELWLPANAQGRSPLVVLIHGGCWLEAYDIAHIRPLATALANKGYAVWALEYRRVGQDGGGWPGTFQDIADGIDALKELNQDKIDTTRTVVVGHSAGGHLALWAAGRPRLQPEQELFRAAPFMPRGVIGLAAITDLATYARGESSCQQATPRLMGGMAEEHPTRYAQGSPAELGTSLPSVLLHGDADTIVPLEQATAMPSATLHQIEGAGHFDLIHPKTPAFGMLLAEIERTLSP